MEGVTNFDTEKTYDNVMNKFKFGGVSQQGIYLDETVMRMCYTHRRLLSQLAISLIQEGQQEKAKNVLEKAEKEIPAYNVPHDYQSGSLDLVRAYALTNQPQKAQQLIDTLWKKATQYVMWYCSLDSSRFEISQRDCMINIIILQQILDVQDTIDEKQSQKKDAQLEALMRLFQSKGGSFGE